MSHAEFHPQQVIEACNRFDAKRRAMIDEERERMIAEEMKKKPYGFFGSTFTREKAIERLLSDIDELNRLAFAEQQFMVDRVRALAEKSYTNKVVLDSQDVYLLKDFL